MVELEAFWCGETVLHHIELKRKSANLERRQKSSPKLYISKPEAYVYSIKP